MSKFCKSPAETFKAVLLAAGSDGDIHPHMGLGRELMARGHEVLFLTTFDYSEMARECGFEVMIAMGPEDSEEFDHAERLNSISKIKARSRFFSRKIAEICDMAASQLDRRCILVSPPFGYSVAKLLHLRHGVPYVSTVLSPASLCSRRNPPAFKDGEWFSRLPYSARKLLFRGTEQLVVDPVFRSLAKVQIRNLPRPRRILSEWCYSPQRVVGLFPDWFCSRPDDWPDQVVLTGFPLFDSGKGPKELPAGLNRFLDADAGAPPVVFTAGTETHNARTFFKTALQAAQLLGVRAVFLTRLADQLPPLPPTVWHERYAPFHLLLLRSSVLVHHGGIGTTAQCLRAGIPQLVVPGRLDQFDNGRHVERLGCGQVQKDPLDGHAMAESLRSLLRAPGVRNACRSAQARVDPGTTACSRAADLIEETCRTG